MSISLRTFIEQIKTRPAIIWATFHFILLLIVRIITGFNGLYGQDSHAYFGHSQALHAWMQGGPTPGKFFWPEGFPFLGALFSYLFEPIFALQMISLLAASLSVYFFARLLQQLYPQVRHHAPFSFLLIGLSPLVFRGGLLIMAESQSLAFIIAGSYFILRYQFTTHKSAIFLAGLCIGAAIITRYPAALLLSLPTAWLGWFALKKRDYAGIFLLLAGLFLTLAPQFFWGNNHSNGLADHHFLSQWSVGNFFRQDFQMQDGAMHYRFINLAYVMGAYGHPFLVGLSGLLGLFLLLRSGASVWGRWAQVPVILYLLFIGGIPFQNTRFLILPLPFVMILVFGTLAAG
ncbi:MAG TPA: hypothetical protein ENJ82_16565, partial [Bacteroidetes bacterium]|nr:hypothetical protein [Bacteroidota bacterium]